MLHGEMVAGRKSPSPLLLLLKVLFGEIGRAGEASFLQEPWQAHHVSKKHVKLFQERGVLG